MFRNYALLMLVISTIFLSPILTNAREWTIMVYIGADNNLTGYVNEDIDEMESAGSTEDVAIVCQIDGLTGSYYNGYDDNLGDNWSTVRRYYIQSGSTSDERINGGFISDLGELNSEDPDVLRDFVYWSIDTYPANRYMLIIWNHGGGWARPAPGTPPYKAIVWDDTNGDGNGIEFSNGEYSGMLSEIRDYLGKSINIVCFDACVVGLIEAEYETMGYADYLVHSEANVPGDGYDYQFLQALTANPFISEENLINEIVDEYYSYYSSSITLSGLRLDHGHVDFQIALNDFARELILAGGKSNSSIISSISYARDFGSNLVDIYDFADEIDGNNIGGSGSSLDLASQAFKSALGYPPMLDGKPLIASVQRSYTGAHGVMAYTPTSSASSTWNNLDFAECSLWKEFIGGSSSLPTTKLAYWGNNFGKYIETGSTVDLYIDCRNLGSGTASSVTATLSSYDSRAIIGGGSVSFGNITGGAIATSTTPFSVTVSASVPESSFVPFEISFSTGKTHKFILTALGEVNSPPNQTTLVSPFNNARLTDGAVILSWIVPSDPDSDPLHFDIQWDDNPNFGSPTTISSNSSSVGFGPSVPRVSGNCTYVVGSQGEGEFGEGNTYWWRVRSKDEFNNGAWSESRSITINSTLPLFDWHQTTTAQFDADFSFGATLESDQVTIEESSTAFFDNMEYASETAAWSIWNTYDGGTNVDINLEDRRQVSGTYSLRIRDRTTYTYGGAWRNFDSITNGVARVWAKIYNPALGDNSEFLGLYNASDYNSSSSSSGLVVYAKGDTLKFWDGSSNIVHTSMDSMWHYYEIVFDLDAGTSQLFIDSSLAGTYGDNSQSQFTLLGVGTKLIGNTAQGTAYWDDFELSTSGTTDSGVVIGQPVSFDWRPSGASSWGWARWTQNEGDSIKITVQYRDGGAWTDYISGIAPTATAGFDIRDIGSADSVRLLAVLYFNEEEAAPILYDWTVDWNETSVGLETDFVKPNRLSLSQNFPNPFNAATTFSYFIPDEGILEMAIYNVVGERVYEESFYRKAGLYTFRFDASELPSGTYFCKLAAKDEIAERKIVLIK
ncbi:T9SS type A sorting domain-containing protein [bacterium]|nr:T9SS type A sorting domain-containing protein [bacterium]